MATTELDSQALIRRRPSRRLYTWGAIVAVLVVFAGFARTFFLNGYFAHFPLTPLQVFHGIVMTSWFTLFLVQVLLVGSGRTRQHRRLGVYGAILAALVVIVGSVTAVVGVAAGRAPPGAPPLVFLAVPLGDMAAFAVLVATAIALRRRPEHHKRLMLVASLSLLTAAVARIPIGALQAGGLLADFAVTDFVLLACAAVDTVRHRRLHPAFGWGIAFVILSQVGRLVLSGTPQWLVFARWITG